MIIFDMDGTLWDTSEATMKVSIDVVKIYNIKDFEYKYTINNFKELLNIIDNI